MILNANMAMQQQHEQQQNQQQKQQQGQQQQQHQQNQQPINVQGKPIRIDKVLQKVEEHYQQQQQQHQQKQQQPPSPTRLPSNVLLHRNNVPHQEPSRRQDFLSDVLPSAAVGALASGLTPISIFSNLLNAYATLDNKHDITGKFSNCQYKVIRCTQKFLSKIIKSYC